MASTRIHVPALLALALVLLSAPRAFGHDDGMAAGTVSGSRYQNRVYRFSVNIPDGWQVMPPSEHVKLLSGLSETWASKSLIFLLLATGDAPGKPGAALTIWGEKFAAGIPGVDVELGKSALVSFRNQPDMTLVGEPVRVFVGGVDMYRADVLAMQDGQPLFNAVFALAVRDRMMVLDVLSKSRDVLNDAVSSIMGAIEFEPDWGVPPSQLDQSRKTVRISQVVSSSFLSKKISPTYPEAARAANIRGTVVMNALISRAGEVQRLWAIGGHPQLVAAAVEAVRQWSYKPYLLEGVPVPVQTTISVDFELSGDVLKENKKITRKGQNEPASGGLVDGVYSNEYFGFSYLLGGSWFVNDLLNKVEHPGTVFLLGVDRHTDKPLRERIIVLADQASRYHPPLASVSDYVSKLAREQTKIQGRELLRDAYAVDCGGRRCYRADYKETIPGVRSTGASWPTSSRISC